MGQLTSADGTRIGYEQGGSGPPLVLVHGTSAGAGRWAKVLPQLQSRFTVYAMDRRGRGGSGDTPPYAMEREFEDVAAVVESIGAPVDLLGHSFGAICSIEAARRVRNLRRLVLYEPPMPVPGATSGPGVRASEDLQRLQDRLDASDREGVLEIFFRDMNGMPEAQFEAFRQLPEWRSRVAAAHTLPREVGAVQAYRFDASAFTALQVPVLLMLGGESPPYFGSAIDMIARALPQAQRVTLAGQRHVAMDTAPALFADSVLSFLS
ncbi:MAG: alpha/beta hydrolase [Burkholderiales bacterium]|nr:alpha/beta hydrolase [Burkholderiales bacterium]